MVNCFSDGPVLRSEHFEYQSHQIDGSVGHSDLWIPVCAERSVLLHPRLAQAREQPLIVGHPCRIVGDR
jgi:hypothetical protein